MSKIIFQGQEFGEGFSTHDVDLLEKVGEETLITEAQTCSGAINELKDSLSQLYGVGAIWMTLSNLDPNNFMEGTWEKVEGQFLLGSSSTYNVGATGGEAAHKLTITEMPNHGHYLVGAGQNMQAPTTTGTGSLGDAKWSTSGANSMWRISATQSAGGNGAHNNMPPYLVVNIWQRVS